MTLSTAYSYESFTRVTTAAATENPWQPRRLVARVLRAGRRLGEDLAARPAAPPGLDERLPEADLRFVWLPPLFPGRGRVHDSLPPTESASSEDHVTTLPMYGMSSTTPGPIKCFLRAICPVPQVASQAPHLDHVASSQSTASASPAQPAPGWQGTVCFRGPSQTAPPPAPCTAMARSRVLTPPQDEVQSPKPPHAEKLQSTLTMQETWSLHGECSIEGPVAGWPQAFPCLASVRVRAFMPPWQLAEHCAHSAHSPQASSSQSWPQLCMLHASTSSLWRGSQGLQPFSGGCSTWRPRTRWPPPHFREQAPHSDQTAQTQSWHVLQASESAP